MFGYGNGVISGVLVLPSFYRDFNLPPVGTSAYGNITGNIVSFVQVGGIIGVLITFPAMKYLGRKISLAIAAGVYFLGAAVQVSSTSWPHMGDTKS